MECASSYFTLLLVFLSYTQIICTEESAFYSDFDYKDKLLSKVIKMEITLEAQTKSFDEQTARLQDKLTEFTQKMKKNEQILENLNSVVENQVRKVDESLSNSSNIIDRALSVSDETITNALGQINVEFETESIVLQRLLNTSLDAQSSEISHQLSLMDQQLSSLVNIMETLNQAVAFTVYGHEGGSSTPPTNAKVIYPQTAINIGNGYDSTTGVFTAPLTGLYYFSAQFKNNGNGDIWFAIMAEGTIVQNAESDTNAADSTTSMSGAALLQRGEGAWVQCQSGCGSNSLEVDPSYSRNSFSGVLIQATM